MNEINRMWAVKQEGEKALSVYIYGDIEALPEQADDIMRSERSAQALRDRLDAAGDIERIDIYINSYGGSVFEGTAIYNQLKRHPAKKVVHIDGFACSIASVIAMAGDEVLMPKNTLMMIHNAWMMAVGTAAELHKAAEDLDKINAAGRQAYLIKSGGRLNEKDLIEMMDAETWLTAEDCIKYGLADGYEKADAEIDEDEAATKLDGIAAKLRQRIQVQTSLAAQLRELSSPAKPTAAAKSEAGSTAEVNEAEEPVEMGESKIAETETVEADTAEAEAADSGKDGTKLNALAAMLAGTT